MKILVTGATGLIGSNIINYYMDNTDAYVIALSRSEKKLLTIFEQYKDSPRFEYVVQDMAEPFDLCKIVSKNDTNPIDLIYHAAGSAEQNVIKEFPVLVIKPNIIGVTSIFDSMLKQKKETNKSARLIVFSSVTIYGNADKENLYVNEDSSSVMKNTCDYYATYYESKRMVEVIAQSYIRQYGLDAVIIRPSTVYGYSPIMQKSAFFSFITSAINNEDIVLNKANLPRRDNIYIDDFVSGIVCIAENGKTGDVYNISTNEFGGNFAAVDEIAEMIKSVSNEVFEKNISVLYKEQPSSERNGGVVLNNQKLEMLGWKPKFTLKNGVKETLSKYIENYK